jgi:hypothetical protein
VRKLVRAKRLGLRPFLARCARLHFSIQNSPLCAGNADECRRFAPIFGSSSSQAKFQKDWSFENEQVGDVFIRTRCEAYHIAQAIPTTFFGHGE